MSLRTRLSGLFRPTRRHLLSRARAARRDHRPREAALFYEEALWLGSNDAELRIQCGHMRKEAGEFAAALAHYHAALEQRPDDPALAIQIGHLHKLVGRRREAVAEYARALSLDPGVADAAVAPDTLDLLAPHQAAEGLAPRLLPTTPHQRLVRYTDGVEIRRFGRFEIGAWGKRRTLRGVEALHGRAVSAVPIDKAQVLVNGLVLERRIVRGGYPLPDAATDDPYRKYVFNIWFDFSAFAHDLHAVELRLLREDGSTLSFHEEVVIAEPMAESDHRGSDALFTPDSDADQSIEAQVRARPSVVRRAARCLFPAGVRTILVQRTDQVGDLVASVSALRRLRAIFPAARLVGLMTSANADLARTLALFDEVIVVDFPDDPVERRRIMPVEAQRTLHDRLATYSFDLAIDLAQSDVSRDLLTLSGAPFLYGVGGDFPYLSAGFHLDSHDPRSGLDIVPHSAKILAMVEALGAMVTDDPPTIRRADLRRADLARYGIGPDDRYAVLHMGARLAFSRWPHMGELAAILLRESDFRLVVMGGDAGAAPLPPEVLASTRVTCLDGQLPFDDFDRLLSFAVVVVGNDSGPKHLAALRGTPVVTLFAARIAWQEWGQEKVGTIISRKVPCQGCLIHHEPEDCGQDFTCIADIRPREVADEVLRYARATDRVDAAHSIVTASS